MRYARQNVLLEHCPQDAFAYTHGTPAEPSRWQSADAGALHLQAVTVPDLPGYALSVTLGPSVAYQFHVASPCNVITGVCMHALRGGG